MMEDFVKKTIEDKQEHEGDEDEVKPEDANESTEGYENLLNKIENNKSYVLNKDFYPFKTGDIIKTRTTNKIIEYKKVSNGKAKGSWHSVIGENATEFLNSIGANDTLAENPEVSSHSDRFDFLFKEGSHDAELVREILSDKLKQYDIDWSSDVGAFVINNVDPDKKVAQIKLMDNNTREIFEANVENGEILINEFEQAIRQTVRESEDVAADYAWRTDKQRERIERDANPEEKKAFKEVTTSVKAEADNTQIEFKTEVSNISPDASKVVNSFDNFDFNGAKNKNDLISLMNRFYKSLGEKHIENNETVGNLILFVNDNDQSCLESAKKNLEKINDNAAKGKLEELIAKCEEIVREEQTENKDINEEKGKWEEMGHYYENVKKDYETRFNKPELADSERKEMTENLHKFASEFNNELLNSFKIKISDENINTAFGMQKKIFEELIKKYDAGVKEQNWNKLEDSYKEMKAFYENSINIAPTAERKKEIIDNLRKSINDFSDSLLTASGLDITDENRNKALEMQKKTYGEIIEKYENELKQQSEPVIKPDQLLDQKLDESDLAGLESELKKTLDYLDSIQKNPDPATFAAEYASFGAYKDKIEKKIEKLKSESGATAGSAQEAIKTGEKEQTEGEMFETMSEEEIRDESHLDVLQYEIDQAIYYLNNAKNISAEKHSDLSEYINKLQFRKGQLQKITESEEFKKISNGIKDLNKPLKTERSSEKEEISNIENSKNIEELENLINKLETSSLHGEKYSFMKNLQDVLRDILTQFVDAENKRIKEDISAVNLRKLYAGNVENETAKSYIEALVKAIENIKAEQEKGFKIGDKVHVLEEDNKVRGGWIVAKIEGKNIEVKNEKTGQTLNRTFGELVSSNNAKLTQEWAVERKKELAEEIKRIKDEADKKGEDLSKNETYQKLTKELEEFSHENISKIDVKMIIESDEYKKIINDLEKFNDSKIKLKVNPAFEISNIQTAKTLEDFDNIRIRDENLRKSLENIITLLTDKDTNKIKDVNFEDTRKAMTAEIKNDDIRSYVETLLKTLERIKNEEKNEGADNEKNEKTQNIGNMVESLKKMTELFEKRQVLFENLENDKDVKEAVEKVSAGEKLSDLDKKLYKTRSMARDEVILSKIGVSMAQSSEYYKKSTIDLPHAEKMKILDAQIMRVRLENELYKQLALSIHTTNEKMDQISPKRKDVASKIVDGILSGAKNVPILKNLVYKSSEFKSEEEKKKDESIKQGAIVGVKNEGEGWKVIKIEGDKVMLEKESRATKKVKEKDLMTWNGIMEKGKFKKGDKVRVIRSDSQIDIDWTVEEIESGKITVSKDNVKTQKTVKSKDVIIPEKTAESEEIKELAKVLNGLKDNELNLEAIKPRLSEVDGLDNVSNALKNKLTQLSQNASFFKGLSDKVANDMQNALSVDPSWYNDSIKEKVINGKIIDQEKDKKQMNQKVENDVNLIKGLPNEFKDFKESFSTYIKLLGDIYHQAEYSDKKGDAEAEKDKTKETDDLLKKIFNSNQIKTISESDSAQETLEAIEKVKEELKPKIKDNSVIEACFQTLDRITSDAKTNTRIRGYSRDILKDDIEKIENKNAKKYLNAVLKNVDNLIKNRKDTLESKQKTAAKTKKKRGK